MGGGIRIGGGKITFEIGQLLGGDANVGDLVINNDELETIVEVNKKRIKTMTRAMFDKNNVIIETGYIIDNKEVKVYYGISFREGTEEYKEADKQLRRAA